MASQQAPEVVPPIPSGQPQPQNQETATHRQPYQALPSTSQSQARFDSISIFPDAYRGTDYPSNPRFICMLEYSESIFSKPISYITVEAAVRQLQSLYGPGKTISRRRRSALSRLTKYLGRLQISGRWSADVIFKIFHDLDVALFGRILCRNVSMGWKTEDSTPGMKTIPAVTYGLSGWNKGRGQRVHIALNGNMCLLDARRTLKDVVDVLLHEMIVSLPLSRQMGLPSLLVP